MTPMEFARQFDIVVRAQTVALRTGWDDRRQRTAAMYAVIDEVAPALGVRVCLNPRQVRPREYYKLDAVYYDGEGPTYDGWQYAWRIEAAIEIENNARNSHIEMNKLVLFNTPLKVLITFPRQHTVGQLLEMFAGIARRGDMFGDFATRRRHLVILGVSPHHWAYYTYDGQAFLQVHLEEAAQ